MTRYQPIWLQGGNYSAIQDRMLVAAALGGGGVLPAGNITGMTPQVAGSSMNVQITAGRAVVPVDATSPAAYLCVSDAPEQATSPAAPASGQSRIDLFIIRPRDPAVNAAYTQNDWIFDVVPGTPVASGPTVPATPAGCLAVCQVLVVGGQATLSQANLTDMRVPGGQLWNAAWGHLGFFQTSADAVATSTTPVVAAGQLVLTIPAGRKLELSAVQRINSTAASSLARSHLVMDGSIQTGFQTMPTVTGGAGAIDAAPSIVVTPSAGQHTFTQSILRVSGSGNVTLQTGARMDVIDIGPATPNS